MNWIKVHGKALGALVIAIGVTVQAALSGDGHVSGEEGFQIAVSAATALGVYLVPAVPQWPWMKTAQAALLAGVTAAGSYAVDGWSSADTMATVLAALGVLVVGVLPAESTIRPNGIAPVRAYRG